MRASSLKTVQMLILVGVLICAVVAHAEEQSPLASLLIDLEGWKAEDAENNSMDLNGMKMMLATRDYTKGDDLSIEVTVFIGNKVLMQGKVAEMTGGDVKSETADSRTSVSKIDGFQVYATYDKENNESDIVVFLVQTETDGALFTFTGEGVAEKEALELAKKFDWKKMKTEVEKLLKQK